MTPAPRPPSPLGRQLALCLQRLDPAAPPAVLHAVRLVSEAMLEGDVCIELAAHAAHGELEAWAAALRASALVGRPGDFAPLILDERRRLYLARYWNHERKLADDLLARAAAPFDDIDAARLQADLDRLFGAPPANGVAADGQRAAAEKAVLRRLCVISGGPGTGKTSTVVRLLAALQMHYRGALVIRLAAPTGKAAARMQEAVREAKRKLGLDAAILAAIPEQAGTLHRLLGTRPDSPAFRHDRSHPLPLDVLVVDEASMIDLALMSRLAEALPPHARLILLGDRDQLASVEAGAVFGDLCAGAGTAQIGFADAIALLHKSYRFGADSGIGKLAQAIRRGDAEAVLALLRTPPAPDLRWREDGWRDHGAALALRLHQGYRDYFSAVRARAPVDALFGLFGRFRVLCAHREGGAGVEGLNRLLEDGLRSGTENAPRGPWYHGRPVMVTRNDYPLALFNGDIGIAFDSGGEDGLRVYFQGAEGQLRDFAPGRLPPHETVYAMTVHKSQGSEFDDVLLVLPDTAAPVLNRALLYTAVTRARRHVELWGEAAILEQAVSRESARSSGLKERLWPR